MANADKEGTISVTAVGSASLGGANGIGGEVGFAFDMTGNVGFTFSIGPSRSNSNGKGQNFSGGIKLGVTNAPSIDKLNGIAANFGASGVTPAGGIGFDIIGFRDDDNYYIGFSGAGLWGIGFEYHLSGGTSKVYYVNIYDSTDQLLEDILSKLII